MTSNDDYVLQLLQEQGMVSQEQIDAASANLAVDGSAVIDQLLADGALSEENLLSMLAAQFGMDFVNIDAKALDTDLASVITVADASK